MYFWYDDKGWTYSNGRRHWPSFAAMMAFVDSIPKDTVDWNEPSEELCDDEGCDHYGTDHVCISTVPAAAPEKFVVPSAFKVRGRTYMAGDARLAAKYAYAYMTDNDPIIHCNRFPNWSELDESIRLEWVKEAIPIEGNTPPMDNGHEENL